MLSAVVMNGPLRVNNSSVDTLVGSKMDLLKFRTDMVRSPGPSCSELMMSLVNDSLKFTSSDMQIC